MIAKCNKCGGFTPYLLEDIIEEKSRIEQLDLFGNKEPIIVGIVKCNKCGERIEVKNRKDTITDLNLNE